MKTQPIEVLLVEDSPADAVLTQASLEALGSVKFNVVRVERLTAAIAHAKAAPVDVLLLDLGLPDAQGLDAFARAHAALPDVPILVLSGLSDEEIAVQCVQQGAQDYLLKGAMMHDVLPRAIRYAIERHRAQQEVERYAGDLMEKNAALEEDLKVARGIQQALLPHHYPQFFDPTGAHKNTLHFAHYYQAATGLSGDFFHILRLSDHKVGMLICDVMGHGVRAALIGALARGLVEQFASVAGEPGVFLGAINHSLSGILKESDTEAFSSAFYLVADVTKGEARFANAGHPSGLILRRTAGTVEWLQVTSPYQPPLGLIGETTYRTSRCAITKGDSIVLFTDGLYEVENGAGEHLGAQRLIDAVIRRQAQPCETLLPDLARDSQLFSGHEAFDDDVCMVGMDVVNGMGNNAKAA